MRYYLLVSILVCGFLPHGELCASTNVVSHAEISKVLVHFLDGAGRESLKAGLTDRDKYQFFLRTHPERQKGLRVQVQWSRGSFRRNQPVTLRMDLRGTHENKPTELVIEKPSRGSGWVSLDVNREQYKNLGQLIAWRAQVIHDGNVVAERRSFLWGGNQPAPENPGEKVTREASEEKKRGD